MMTAHGGLSISENVRNVTDAWVREEITDAVYLKNIKYHLENGQLAVPDLVIGDSGGAESIPSWVRTSAAWWSDGQIDDSSFVQGIHFLAANRMLSAEIEEGFEPFGIPSASLIGRVFFDGNGNDVQDAGEAGIPGLTVLYIDLADHSKIVRVTTDANGDYAFHILPGDYLVQVEYTYLFKYLAVPDRMTTVADFASPLTLEQILDSLTLPTPTRPYSEAETLERIEYFFSYTLLHHLVHSSPHHLCLALVRTSPVSHFACAAPPA